MCDNPPNILEIGKTIWPVDMTNNNESDFFLNSDYNFLEWASAIEMEAVLP